MGGFTPLSRCRLRSSQSGMSQTNKGRHQCRKLVEIVSKKMGACRLAQRKKPRDILRGWSSALPPAGGLQSVCKLQRTKFQGSERPKGQKSKELTCAQSRRRVV